jgi:tagatose 6-phosphate kinase
VNVVAGLTPAWQQIMSFAQFHQGEVNRAADVQWCASGKAINVAIALASLDVPTQLLSPAGGWTGEAMRAELAERHVKAAWTNTGSATRVCTTILNQADGTATELVENASALSTDELRAFQSQYHSFIANADFAVLTGSLPRGTPTTYYRELLECTSCPVLLDVRGPELLEALACEPRVVKPNREELAATMGRALLDRAAVFGAMRELIERGAGSVVVTQGKDVVWIMQGSDVWELTPPNVTTVVNPIGCGDCLAAGVAWGLTRGDTLVDAVRLGIAAAGDNVTQLLPARLSLKRVEAFMQQVRVTAIA